MNLLLIFIIGIGLVAFLSLFYSALSRKRVEKRLNSVLESSPAPTFVIGRDHRVIYWNRAMEKLDGGQGRGRHRHQGPLAAVLQDGKTLHGGPGHGRSGGDGFPPGRGRRR